MVHWDVASLNHLASPVHAGPPAPPDHYHLPNMCIFFFLLYFDYYLMVWLLHIINQSITMHLMVNGKLKKLRKCDVTL